MNCRPFCRCFPEQRCHISYLSPVRCSCYICYFVIDLLNKNPRLYRSLGEGIRMNDLESDHVRGRCFYETSHGFCSMFSGSGNLVVQFSIYSCFDSNLSDSCHKLLFLVFVVITGSFWARLFSKGVVVFARGSWLFFAPVVGVCSAGRSLTVSTDCWSRNLALRVDDVA